MGIDLVTLSEYKAYAGINSTNQDAAIATIIPKVSQLIKSICKRTFVDWVNTTKVEVMRGGNGYKLFMKEYPLLAVVGVEYSVDYGATFTYLVKFTDYVVDLEEGTIVNILIGNWPKAINGYRVSYTAGFEEIPTDLKLAVFDTITYYLRHETSVHSTRNIGSNTVQIEYITNVALPAHITRILDLYKASYD